MKNLTLILFLAVSSLQLFSQDAVRKVNFGITVNPQMNLTSFGGNKNVEKVKSLCFGSSADVYFDLSSRIQLKTGVGIQYLTLRHRDRSARWPVQGMNGEFMPGSPDAYFGYNTNYLYAALPVNLKMKIGDNSNHVYLTSGLNLNVLMNDSGEIVINEGGGATSTPIDGFLFKTEAWLVNFDFGAGYEKEVGKMKMFLEPNLQYSLGQFFEEKQSSARANGHILLLGITFGLIL